MHLFSPPAHSQISERLYKQLPEDLKPKDKAKLTLLDKRYLICYAHRYADIHDVIMVREINGIATGLEQESEKADRKNKAYNFLAIGYYNKLFLHNGSLKGEAIPYFEKVIEFARGDTSMQNTIAAAYIGIGNIYSLQEEYEKSIKILLDASDVLKTNIDSGTYFQLYESIGLNYQYLGLYKQAIKYRNLSDQFVSREQVLSGEALQFYVTNLLNNSELYMNWYRDEKNKAYLDSAWTLIHRIPLNGANASRRKEDFIYHLGLYYFASSQYNKALSLFDSAIAIEDYNRDIHNYFSLYKGICLLKLGKSAGSKLILNNPVTGFERELAQQAYYALSENATAHNDDKAALRYFQMGKKYQDTAAVLKHRGQVLEIAEKYNVGKKQNDLDKLGLVNDKLHFQNLAQVRLRNMILFAGIVLTLLLMFIIAVLYAISKKRQIEGLIASKALHNEELKLSYFLSEQERNARQERDVAATEQRRKISRDLHDGLTGTLSALKFLINDKRLSETDEKGKKVLRDIEQEVADIYDGARDYMHDLYNGKAGDFEIDLVSFLSSLESKFSDPGGFLIKVYADTAGILKRLSSLQQGQLYLIISESINNTLKHGNNADLLIIKIELGSDRCFFNIADNGKSIGETHKIRGLGLDSIATRISTMNGHFIIGPTVDGYVLDGWFPVPSI